MGEDVWDVEVSPDRVVINGREREASLVQVRGNHYSLILDGRSYSLVIQDGDDGKVDVQTTRHPFSVHVQDERDLLLERFGLQADVADGLIEVRAPMPGLVVRVMVDEGQRVESGDGLLVLEAMKMENELSAEAPGIIKKIHIATGDAVTKNALLIELEAGAA